MKVYLSAEDRGPFLELLKENGVPFTRRMFTQDSVGGGVQFLYAEIAEQSPALLALAAVIIAYIKAHHGRKITVKKGQHSVKIEGLTERELAKILESPEDLAITRTKDES